VRSNSVEWSEDDLMLSIYSRNHIFTPLKPMFHAFQ